MRARGWLPAGRPEFSLTRGIVSKARANGETSWASVDNVLMHDATINPGNSGGPLVTSDGKVVGVNYAGNANANQYFAITQAEAQSVIEQLRENTDVTSLGINGQAVKSDDGTISGIWVSRSNPALRRIRRVLRLATSSPTWKISSSRPMAPWPTTATSCARTAPSDTLNISVLRFADKTMMEGQVNGRKLEVSFSFAQELGSEVGQTGGTTGEADYSEYVKVTDDTGSIEIEIPAEWAQTDGSTWETNWGDISISAPAITAAADLDKYNNGWSELGVLCRSSDMGRTGRIVQLVEGVRNWYKNDCRRDSAEDYKDNLYEGRYELWKNCGPEKSYAFVLSARPIEHKTSFLILLELRITKDADLKALDQQDARDRRRADAIGGERERLELLTRVWRGVDEKPWPVAPLDGQRGLGAAGSRAHTVARGRADVSQWQFHCGKPPPAAEPRTRTRTGAASDSYRWYR